MCAFSSLLSVTSLSEEQSEYVRSIEISTHHLLTVITDLLDYQKIDAGKMELELTAAELSRLVEEAVDIACRSPGPQVLTFIDPTLPDKVQVDSTRLRQVISNVLSNAVKFGRGNDIFIRVRELGAEDDHLYALQPLSAEQPRVLVPNVGVPYRQHSWQADERVEMPAATAGELLLLGMEGTASSTPMVKALPPASPLVLVVSIEDGGSGIAKAHLHKLFKPFSQSDASISRQYGGTGLGLVISGKLVQLMGGSIWCESQHGLGSKFSFSFPAGQKEPTSVPATPLTSATSSSQMDASHAVTTRLETEQGVDFRMSASDSTQPCGSPITSSSAFALPLQPVRFSLRVLLISPNVTLLHTLASTLLAWGCAPFACETAEDAAAFMRTEQRLDLVLVDYCRQTLPESVDTQPVSASCSSSCSTPAPPLPLANRIARSQSVGAAVQLEDTGLQLAALVGLPPAPPLIGSSAAASGESVSSPSILLLIDMEDEKLLQPLSIPSHRRLRKPLKQSELQRALYAAETEARQRRQTETLRPSEVCIAVNETDSPQDAKPLLHSNRSVSAPGTMKRASAAHNGKAAAAVTLLAREFPLRIICAEDNVINQRLFVRMMQRLGYVVDIADNGLRLIEKMRDSGSRPYDLIFMDLQASTARAAAAADSLHRCCCC